MLPRTTILLMLLSLVAGVQARDEASSAAAPSAARKIFVAKAAMSPPPAAASTPHVAAPVARSEADSDRTYAPLFLPREVEFQDGQLAAIRDAVTKQMVAYHLSRLRQNETYAAFQAAEAERWNARASYDQWAVGHTRGVFEGQSRYTQVIFWVVIAIVLSGLLLTWYQFFQDSSIVSSLAKSILRRRPTTGSTPESNAAILALLEAVRAEQSAEWGKDGVKVKTRVIGLLTLILSMGFFYLYLVYVYPINIKEAVPVNQPEKTSTGSGSK